MTDHTPSEAIFVADDGSEVYFTLKRTAEVVAPISRCTVSAAVASLRDYLRDGLIYVRDVQRFAGSPTQRLGVADVCTAAIVKSLPQGDGNTRARNRAAALACYAYDEGQPQFAASPHPIVGALMRARQRGDDRLTLEIATMRHRDTGETYLKAWVFSRLHPWEPPETIGHHYAAVTMGFALSPILWAVHAGIHHLLPPQMDPTPAPSAVRVN